LATDKSDRTKKREGFLISIAAVIGFYREGIEKLIVFYREAKPLFCVTVRTKSMGRFCPQTEAVENGP